MGRETEREREKSGGWVGCPAQAGLGTRPHLKDGMRGMAKEIEEADGDENELKISGSSQD